MWKLIKKTFSKGKSIGDAWASVKKQFNLGELVHEAPGLKVFKEKSSQNLMKVASGKAGLVIEPLYPTSMKYGEYMAQVEKPAGVFKIHSGGYYQKRYPHIGKVTPAEYTNKTGPGGLSKEYSFPNLKETYFVPRITCI